MLYNLAAVNGDEDYINNRNTLSRQLSSAQLSEAQALAAKWKVGTPIPTSTKTFQTKSGKLNYKVQANKL